MTAVGFDTMPSMCTISQYHVLAEVNLDPKPSRPQLDLQVDPGRTLTLHGCRPRW